MLRRWVFPVWVLTVCVLAAAQVWLPYQRGMVAQETTQLKKERILVQQDVQNLKLELASLMRPDTLRRLAHQKLGMHAPTAMQVLNP